MTVRLNRARLLIKVLGITIVSRERVVGSSEYVLSGHIYPVYQCHRNVDAQMKERSRKAQEFSYHPFPGAIY